MRGNNMVLERLRGKHVREQAGRVVCFVIALVIAVVF